MRLNELLFNASSPVFNFVQHRNETFYLFKWESNWKLQSNYLCVFFFRVAKIHIIHFCIETYEYNGSLYLYSLVYVVMCKMIDFSTRIENPHTTSSFDVLPSQCICKFYFPAGIMKHFFVLIPHSMPHKASHTTIAAID